MVHRCADIRSTRIYFHIFPSGTIVRQFLDIAKKPICIHGLRVHYLICRMRLSDSGAHRIRFQRR